jgi:antibiotic biosynthesis monooxygenase (ABM) superfamily enzyme
MTLEQSDGVVTLLIRHRVRPGEDEAYEDWLRRIVRTAHGYPGHLGIDIIRSRDGDLHLFTCVLRFASAGQLQDWMGSDDRKRLVEEVSPLLATGDEQELNPTREFWFTPTTAGSRKPPRWKQACVTFLVILPLSLLVPRLWQPAFEALPWLGGCLPSNALITLTIVLLVVYLFMPRVTRWLAHWLDAP